MSSMDTLRAARTLKAAGIDEEHAEAITQVINDLGRDNLVTKDHLDARLWQLGLAMAATTFALLSLFKFFG